MMVLCMDPRVMIGRWCLEEDSAIGGSGTADAFLAIGGLLGLALDGLEVHVNRIHCVRGGGCGWLWQRAAVDCDCVVEGKRELWCGPLKK